MSNLTSKTVGMAPLKKMAQLINDRKEQAQILVDQFKSVFTTDKNDLTFPNTKRRAMNPIPPLKITVQGVEKLLLNISKAHRPDLIPNIMLKTCAWQSAPALRTIF